jgi:hypothetical protein
VVEERRGECGVTSKLLLQWTVQILSVGIPLVLILALVRLVG